MNNIKSAPRAPIKPKINFGANSRRGMSVRHMNVVSSGGDVVNKARVSCQKPKNWMFYKCTCNSVADLREGRQGRSPPPLGQNFFIFMQFSGKIRQIVGWRPPL